MSESFGFACVDATNEHWQNQGQNRQEVLTFFSLSIHLLMAMTEDPVRSLSAKIASVIRAMVAMVHKRCKRIFFTSKAKRQRFRCSIFRLETPSCRRARTRAPDRFSSCGEVLKIMARVETAFDNEKSAGKLSGPMDRWNYLAGTDVKAAIFASSQINRLHNLLQDTLNSSRGRKASAKRENDWLERKPAPMEKKANKRHRKTTWWKQCRDKIGLQ